MSFQIKFGRNLQPTSVKSARCFCRCANSLCYNLFFRGRRKWPQASRISRPRSRRGGRLRIPEACGQFRQPRTRNYSTVNFALRQKKRALFTEVGYRLLSKFDLERSVLHIVNLKHAFHILFSIRHCKELLFNKKKPEKCPQSSPRAPKASPNCLRGPSGRPEQPRSAPKAIFVLIS